MGEGWTWLREHPEAWRIKDGASEIRVEPGVAARSRTPWSAPAPDRRQGKFAIEVTVTNLTKPTQQYEQAGHHLVHDGKPVFKLVKELIDGELFIIPGKKPMAAESVQLRLIVTADSWTAQFRPDGQGEFQTAADGQAPAARRRPGQHPMLQRPAGCRTLDPLRRFPDPAAGGVAGPDQSPGSQGPPWGTGGERHSAHLFLERCLDPPQRRFGEERTASRRPPETLSRKSLMSTQTPCSTRLRHAGEWEPHEATWLAGPERDGLAGQDGRRPVGLRRDGPQDRPGRKGADLRRLEGRRDRARRVLDAARADLAQVEFFRYPTNRGWMRDSGPIFVRRTGRGRGRDGRSSHFHFNAWARYDDWQRDRKVPRAGQPGPGAAAVRRPLPGPRRSCWKAAASTSTAAARC